MKIEKLMSIESFLEICHSVWRSHSFPEKYTKSLEKNISKSIQKSKFEPVDNPLDFQRDWDNGTGGNVPEYERSFYMWFYKDYVYAPKDILKKDYSELRRGLISKEHIVFQSLKLFSLFIVKF